MPAENWSPTLSNGPTALRPSLIKSTTWVSSGPLWLRRPDDLCWVPWERGECFIHSTNAPSATTTSGDKHRADFIGHYPWRHRGTCQKRRCIYAYYGINARQWPTPNRDDKKKPLLDCQAAGCRKRIEGWAARCFSVGRKRYVAVYAFGKMTLDLGELG
ncbi:hypothetical protein N657DRAFT_263982 [Parathielavia appendiculata]|uniref:Uncharacterized protein n=1 Tax=Parathielavia appendiculata TaxID=2587402 RepID=A0AAN6TRG6_9PEZI|nr:hypothetical protein N657DRAFT_263982 [Parathielavia appendiculata]